MDLALFKDLKETQKIKTDVNHLKEKILKENAKIIKLKVGQDTAYWELAEKLSTTERHHATLQRNMVELQMEHETVSAHYQEELRQRPEILNKVESTREICDALEENLSRVRASLRRSAADRAALADAYTRAGAAVAEATADNEKRLAAAENEARHARDLGAHLMESLSRECSRAEQSVAEAERLRKQQDMYNEQLARFGAIVQEKDKKMEELREEFRGTMKEFNDRYERATSVIGDLERQAGAAAGLRAALSQAEARGEAAARDVARLTAELAALQLAKDEVTQQVTAYGLQIQEFQSHDDEMKKAMHLLTKLSEDLAQQLKGKDQEICSLSKAVNDSKHEAYELAERAAIAAEEFERERRNFEKREAERDNEIRDCEQRMANVQNELIERSNAIDNLLRDIAELKEEKVRTEATVAEQKALLELERGDSEKRTAIAESKIAEYTEMIDHLKNNIDIEKEQRSKAEVAFAELTTIKEQERREYEERIQTAELKIAELNDTVADVKRELAAVTEARELTDNTLKQMEAERSLEREAFEKHATDAEQELTKCENSIIHYKTKLTLEAEERARLETALKASREELNVARQDIARALDDVRHLKADCRRKDEEAEKQMQIILNNRTEREDMQIKMKELEDKIKNIQKITLKPQAPPNSAPSGFRREPPEHDDDNAVSLTPNKFRKLDQPTNTAQPRAPTPTILSLYQQKPKNTDKYNMFSDDSDSLNLGFEINRNNVAGLAVRSEQQSEFPFSLNPPASVNRRRASNQRQPTQPATNPGAATQPPAAAQPERPRKFFKTKRTQRN